MKTEDIIRDLEISIGEKRLKHSLRVMEMAIELAGIYNIDEKKAKLAALLHDCGRLLDEDLLLKMAEDYGIITNRKENYKFELLHGPLGKIIAKEKYNIEDEDILNAIKRHTIGSVDMTNLDKIVYIADKLERKRNFPGIEDLRDLVRKDLDLGFLKVVDSSIKYLLLKGEKIDIETIKMRNLLLEER